LFNSECTVAEDFKSHVRQKGSVELFGVCCSVSVTTNPLQVSLLMCAL